MMDVQSQKRSAICLYFSVISDVNAKCNLCNNHYSYKGGNVSNLRKHLKTKHLSILLEEPSEKTKKICQVTKVTSHYPKVTSPFTKSN